MGYSSNPAVLEARRSWLTELELGRACRWTTKADFNVTRRRAYELREALYIASLYPDAYPALAQAHSNFQITIIKPGLIEAKPKLDQSDLAVVSGSVPIHGIEPFGKPLGTVGITTADQAIEAWQAHAPSLDAINFQQSALSLTELTLLYNWAIDHTPKLMMLVGEGFLTLSLRDAEVAGYAWQPPQTAAKPEEDFDV